jgi:hypothetical protein
MRNDIRVEVTIKESYEKAIVISKPLLDFCINIFRTNCVFDVSF